MDSCFSTWCVYAPCLCSSFPPRHILIKPTHNKTPPLSIQYTFHKSTHGKVTQRYRINRKNLGPPPDGDRFSSTAYSPRPKVGPKLQPEWAARPWEEEEEEEEDERV